MEIGTDVLQLLRRHSEIRRAMRQPGGVRILEERELHAIDQQLRRMPAAVRVLQPDAPLTASIR